MYKLFQFLNAFSVAYNIVSYLKTDEVIYLPFVLAHTILLIRMISHEQKAKDRNARNSKTP